MNYNERTGGCESMYICLSCHLLFHDSTNHVSVNYSIIKHSV